MLARNFHVSNLTPSGHRNPDYTVLLILVCIISCKFSHLSHLFVFSFTLISYISYTLDLTVTPEDVCWSIRNVKFDTIKVSYTMQLLYLMFVTPVCVLFLLFSSHCGWLHTFYSALIHLHQSTWYSFTYKPSPHPFRAPARKQMAGYAPDKANLFCSFCYWCEEIWAHHPYTSATSLVAGLASDCV